MWLSIQADILTIKQHKQASLIPSNARRQVSFGTREQ